MEKISLPTRTVAARKAVVIPLAMVVVLLMLGWMFRLCRLGAADSHYSRGFRYVVLTSRTIKQQVEGELVREETLFLDDGVVRHALAPGAKKAFTELDTWNAELPYLYARALWREYSGKIEGGYTRSGLEKNAIPPEVAMYLQLAMQRDPTNRFYRATYAGVLTQVPNPTPEMRRQIEELLIYYPPRNAYGQIRTADRLLAIYGDVHKTRAIDHYCESLRLVSADLGSGLKLRERRLVTPRAPEGKPTPPPRVILRTIGPLAQTLRDRALETILKTVGVDAYNDWSRRIPDEPEARWLVARHFKLLRLEMQRKANEPRTTEDAARALRAYAAKCKVISEREFQNLVRIVNRRIEFQKNISARRWIYDMLVPSASVDFTDRFLKGREIGYAARYLENVGTDLEKAGDVEKAHKIRDRACDLYREQIARRPTEITPRVNLASLLVLRGESKITEAQGLKTQAVKARSDNNLAEAGRLEVEAGKRRKEAEPYWLEADENLSKVLRKKARMVEALDLRGRIAKATGEE